MSFPQHHINQDLISYLRDDYECSMTTQGEIETPGSGLETTQYPGFNPNPIEACIIPNYDLSEYPGYSRLLIEQYHLDALKNPLLAESLAGVFSEVPLMSQSDPNFDSFSMENTVEGGYGGYDTANHGNYYDPPLLPLLPPKPPTASSSNPIRNSEKKHICPQCGLVFDRWTRARDCAYKDLDQAPHQCGGRCGNVACTFTSSSEQLLTEHLNPRSVACPLWKNLARHRKESCVNRSLAANAHSEISE